MLGLILLVLPVQASYLIAPPCLTVLEPTGIDPLSKHAGEHGNGRTHVLLRYSPTVDVDGHFQNSVAPDLQTTNVAWRLHIFTQQRHMHSFHFVSYQN